MSESTVGPRAEKRQGWTKARAILAGGLVLGVGTAITLAAWSDNEWAKGLFQSGKFGIEGSTNGTTFASHPDAASAAQLDFTVAANRLSPNDTVYAGFAVRLTADSTNQAAVTMTQDTAAAIPGTTATHKIVSSATCDAAAFNASTDTATSFNLTALNAPVFVCFKVSADGTLQQGQSGSIVWDFAATSTGAI